MVPPAGIEPAIFALKGRRPRPLDDGDVVQVISMMHTPQNSKNYFSHHKAYTNRFVKLLGQSFLEGVYYDAEGL